MKRRNAKVARDPFMHGARRAEQIDCNKVFAERFRIIRLVLGWTEKQAADRIGVTVATYRAYENEQDGRQRRGGVKLMNYLHGLNISADWFFAGDGSRLGEQWRSGKIAILPVSTPSGRDRAQRRMAIEILNGLSPQDQAKAVARLEALANEGDPA